jgi:hypothetical protein
LEQHDRDVIHDLMGPTQHRSHPDTWSLKQALEKAQALMARPHRSGN